MRLLILLTIGLGLLGSRPGRAQSPVPAGASGRYWVSFRDKQGVGFDAATYFSPAAQARRRRQGLPPADATDRPVRPDYLAAVRQRVDTLTVVSRWLNGVACRATPTQAAALRRLPGVATVVAWPVVARLRPAAHRVDNKIDNPTSSLAAHQPGRLPAGAPANGQPGPGRANAGGLAGAGRAHRGAGRGLSGHRLAPGVPGLAAGEAHRGDV